jgi:Ca2+-binding RTX toxin-like protein
MSVIIDLLNLLKIHIDGPQGHVLEGDALVNVLVGTGGDDYVEGKGLADVLSGGAGVDTLGYVSSNAGVNVDLTPNLLGLVTLASGGHATGDIITADFENLIGSNFNDTLKGTSGANTIAGLAGNDSIYGRDGNDILIGGAGADYLDGGNGFDIADYSSSAAGIHLVADASGHWTGIGGDAQGDTLVGIEEIIGTHGDDIIDDSAATTPVFIDGGGGNDTEYGGSGNDIFIIEPGTSHDFGGAGDDTFILNDHTFDGASTDPGHPSDLGEFDGGDGENVLDYSALTSGIEITLFDLPAAFAAQGPGSPSLDSPSSRVGCAYFKGLAPVSAVLSHRVQLLCFFLVQTIELTSQPRPEASAATLATTRSMAVVAMTPCLATLAMIFCRVATAGIS